MKKIVIIPLIALLLTSFSCDTKQKGPSNLSVGKSKLIHSGNALEAVELLEKAEREEANKLEPRALLVIAYSHGLATGDAASLGVEAKFKNQRSQRIEEMTDPEIRQILQILSTPSRVQKAGLQALVDKGPEVSTIILESLAKGRYPALHENFTEMLVQIGPDGLDLILAKLTDEMTPPALKIKLTQVLSEIDDPKSIDALKTLQSQTDDAALAMEINTTLYQLGEIAYKQDIIDGLNHSDIAVRRTAAKAMVDIAGISTKILIAGLEDDDSEVVAALVKALAVHQDAAAVDPLVKILTSELNKDPKQAAIDTLDIYGQKKLTGGLAKPITMLLIGGTVSDPDNRLYLVQLLKREPFQRQLRALQSVEGLVDKLYQYHQNTETVGLVKRPLGELLDAVGK